MATLSVAGQRRSNDKRVDEIFVKVACIRSKLLFVALLPRKRPSKSSSSTYNTLDEQEDNLRVFHRSDRVDQIHPYLSHSAARGSQTFGYSLLFFVLISEYPPRFLLVQRDLIDSFRVQRNQQDIGQSAIRLSPDFDERMFP